MTVERSQECPVVPEPSQEWEACNRCGERLEFPTNGMGRVLAWCPVCDGKQRPRRDYTAYQQRLVREPVPEPPRKLPLRRCVRCAKQFEPSHQRILTCSNACRQSIKRAQNRKCRRGEKACEICGHIFARMTRVVRYCHTCRSAVNAKQKREWHRRQREQRLGGAA